MRLIHVEISRRSSVAIAFLVVLSVSAGILVMRSSQGSVPPKPELGDRPSDMSTNTSSAHSDEDARDAAILAAVTYLTLDDRGSESWGQRMAAIVDDPVIIPLLAKSLLPVFESASIACVPKPVVAWKVVAGSDEVSERAWQTWRVVLQDTCAWPEPSAAPIGPFAVPWSENGDTAMFVTLFGGKNGWRLGLFPVDAIVESQVESSHQRRAD